MFRVLGLDELFRVYGLDAIFRVLGSVHGSEFWGLFRVFGRDGLGVFKKGF